MTSKPETREYYSDYLPEPLTLTLGQAHTGSHPGQCDADIDYLRQLPEIADQLNKIDPILLAQELKQWGAWDDTELLNHDENLSRYLWLACGGIVENETNDD